MLISQMIAIFCFGSLLWCKAKGTERRSAGMTICMQFYIIAEFASNLGCMPYVIYLIIFWEATAGSYDAFLIFWTGALQTLLLINLPVTVFYLGFDRCCCILAPLKNRLLWERLTFAASLATIFVFVAIAIPLHVLPGYPAGPETICRSFGCLAPNYAGQIYSIFRYVTSVGNVFIGLVLIKLVKKQTSLDTKTFKVRPLNLVHFYRNF